MMKEVQNDVQLLRKSAVCGPVEKYAKMITHEESQHNFNMQPREITSLPPLKPLPQGPATAA